jgi:hypothetical protein
MGTAESDHTRMNVVISALPNQKMRVRITIASRFASQNQDRKTSPPATNALCRPVFEFRSGWCREGDSNPHEVALNGF